MYSKIYEGEIGSQNLLLKVCRLSPDLKKKKKKCAQEVAFIMVEEWRSNSVNTIIRRCIHQGHAVDIIEHPKQQCYSSMYHHWCNFLHSFQCAI